MDLHKDCNHNDKFREKIEDAVDLIVGRVWPKEDEESRRDHDGKA